MDLFMMLRFIVSRKMVERCSVLGFPLKEMLFPYSS